MINFLHKKEWSNKEWSVFFSNLDLLRNKFEMKKGELSNEINVTNIYRTDRKSVSKKIIKAICDKFNVTESWLSTDHTGDNTGSNPAVPTNKNGMLD